ncbi:dTMP kinase [Tepidamorphus sp. 3E244]|uniref:dTMP kinase n=1 Tax=Tepidamorphus sp. 3E244 TaxID=3385498 RepID=UPI0038FD191F
MERGRFITFEGGEGTGKSTQSRRLAGTLRNRGLDVVETREPGGSPAAELIRKIILSGAAEPLGAEAETMLFFAARDDHLNTVIRPALERGQWVVCDRFVDSTRAYQEHAGNVPAELIRSLERAVIGDTWPDLTVILDIDAQTGLTRARGETGNDDDRFERADVAYHERIRDAFRKIAQAEPDRCVLIDAASSPGKVAEAVWKAASKRIELTD